MSINEMKDSDKAVVERDLTISLLYALFVPKLGELKRMMGPALKSIDSASMPTQLYFIETFFSGIRAAIKIMETELIERTQKRAPKSLPD